VPSSLAGSLGSLALFADLPAESLDALAASMREEEFGEGEWILREGDDNAGLRVILDGDAAVVIDGVDRAVLHAGMFFGEISVLLDQPVGASVVSRTPLRCAHIDRSELIPFLLDHPSVTLRLLQAEARRVDDANRWRP
jgi:CRP-like cAMP-binding protein